MVGFAGQMPEAFYISLTELRFENQREMSSHIQHAKTQIV